MTEQPPAFDRVFSEYAAFVWRALARHGVSSRDLEDACQEVFVVVHRRLPAFEGRASLKTWLYGISRRVAANHRRQAVRRREIPSVDLPEPGMDSVNHAEAFEHLAKKQSLALLETLLARLQAEQREVFVLYELEELTMREVAKALGCSQNTAFSRLYAARRQIADSLKRLRAQRRVA